MNPKRNRYRPDRARQKALVLAWIKGIIGVPAGIAGVLLFSAALAHSYHAVVNLPWLNVENIEITGLRQLQRDQVLQQAGVIQPLSMLQVRTATLARRLETHPWIQSAIVRIDPPRRVVIEIQEREPMALVHSQGFFLLDTRGKLFLEAKPEHHQELPLFTGFAGTKAGLGDILSADTMEALRTLLTALNQFKTWLPLTDLSEIRWHEGDGVTLYTTRGAIPVHLGHDLFAEKLKRLQSVQKIIADRQWWDMVQAIDLDYPRMAYVKGIVTQPNGI
jgi:cell division protein FtsQ